jgi:hypothetical protein
MKKLVVAAFAALSLAASAVEVGVTAVDQSSPNPDRYGYGVTVGDTFGGINVTAGVSRFYREANDQTRFSLVASKEVAKLGPVAFSGRVGAAYLDNRTGNDGAALTVGAGASVPVTKTVTAGLSVDRQFGQNRISSFNGNVITAGIKVGF